MSGRQSDGEVEIGSARWPIKWDTANPLWDSCRLIGMDTPTADARVELKFWDADQSLADDKDDLIGVAQCTIGQFTNATTVLELPIALTKRSKISAEKSRATANGDEPCMPYCIVSRRSLSGLPSKKVVYAVRHGESVWNKAQADKDVMAMLSAVDHPLNAAGKAQAEGLRDAIAAGVEIGSDDAKALLAVDAVWCSPLTRAVQTCLIGMSPVLEHTLAAGGGSQPLLRTRTTGDGLAAALPFVSHVDWPQGTRPFISYADSWPQTTPTTLTGSSNRSTIGPSVVHLNPNLREKRNFGGKDSSGKWCGVALADGVRRQLAELYEGDVDTARRLNALPLGLEHVQDQWWLGSKESEQAVGQRIDELLAQVRFSPHESIVLVGHSHYFREVCRRCRAKGCDMTDAAGRAISVSDVEAKKLSNGGIARMELDWSGGEATPVTSFRLLFGTKLVK